MLHELVRDGRGLMCHDWDWTSHVWDDGNVLVVDMCHGIAKAVRQLCVALIVIM